MSANEALAGVGNSDMPAKNVHCAEETADEPAQPFASSTFPEVAVLLVNAKGKITAASDEARALLGLTGRDHVLPAVLMAVVRELVSSGNSTLSRELQLQASSSLTVEVTVQCLPDTTPENRLAMILSAVRTPADPQQELRRLHRLASAGTLSASMAHEVKNALVAGKSFLELLLEKNEDHELVGIVRREMDRIDSLVSQMLKLTRPPRKTRERVKVHQLIELSLRLVQPQFKTKSITVTRLLSAASDEVIGDEQQLEQAFLNLLMNSMEAMGPNGELTISSALATNPASPSRKWLEILIKDNGSGIAPEYLDRLFEPFFTTKKNGSGLGLAISRAIIKEHSGDIIVESEPSEGSTFRVLLPTGSA